MRNHWNVQVVREDGEHTPALKWQTR
ncbi:conserved hypothetical protein [Klebsiella pneumoniae]|nr:conserved hypothetical protein [Klebsiella pneumoniae]SBN02434.1 conserved hypothetical protein [Klebsiella pneumoniae]